MQYRLVRSSTFIIIIIAIVSSLLLSYTNAWAANNDPTQGIRITSGSSLGQPGPGLIGNTRAIDPPAPKGDTGPRGPVGSPGQSRISVVVLEYDEAGHVAGWDPHTTEAGGVLFTIKSSIDLQAGMFIQAMFTNPPNNPSDPSLAVGSCSVNSVNPLTDSFNLHCLANTGGLTAPRDGAVRYLCHH